MSCSSDPCDDVICNNGDCIDGTCACDPGFEGVNCDQATPCFNVDCNNNGDCVDNLCNCDEGFEGVNCETELRAKFLGTWIGPNGCDLETQLIDLPDSISISIDRSDLNALAVEITINFQELGEFPPATAIIENSAFFIDPMTIDIMGFTATYEVTGILRSSGILDVESEIEVDVFGNTIPLSCDALLEVVD